MENPYSPIFQREPSSNSVIIKIKRYSWKVSRKIRSIKVKSSTQMWGFQTNTQLNRWNNFFTNIRIVFYVYLELLKKKKNPTKAGTAETEVQLWRKLQFFKNVTVPLMPYVPHNGDSNASTTWYSPSYLTLIITPMTGFKVVDFFPMSFYCSGYQKHHIQISFAP